MKKLLFIIAVIYSLLGHAIFAAAQGTEDARQQTRELKAVLRPSLHYNPFSISIGAFGVIGGDFYQDTYNWQKQTAYSNVVTGNSPNDTSKYMLVKGGKTSAPAGFSLLCTINLTGQSSKVGFGLSAGLGYAVNTDLPLVYMGGASLLIGNRGQFNITAGVAVKQVSLINIGLYPQNTLYTEPPSTQYYKALVVGGFISVTYKLCNL